MIEPRPDEPAVRVIIRALEDRLAYLEREYAKTTGIGVYYRLLEARDQLDNIRIMVQPRADVEEQT